MATEIYKSGTVQLTDGEELYVTPLKIKYLRQFMEIFANTKKAKDEEESLDILINCVAITMQQYAPELATPEAVEDNFDVTALYKVLDFAAGVSMSEDSSAKQPADQDDYWEKMKLAELEAEVFLLGIWKDYDELESSLSMPELTATLNAKRDADYNERKFFAAIQGIDLDKQTGNKQDNVDPWERIKAKAFSGGKTEDPNDILALQGINASKAGFGIGMGLSYERIG